MVELGIGVPAAKETAELPQSAPSARGRGRPAKVVDAPKAPYVRKPPDERNEKRTATAWTLAHKMLKQYGAELAGNSGKADLHLAEQLMKNGTLLLQYGVPMDNLSQLIRLARDLANKASTETFENPAIEALRKAMERPESSLPPAENDGGVDLVEDDDEELEP